MKLNGASLAMRAPLLLLLLLLMLHHRPASSINASPAWQPWDGYNPGFIWGLWHADLNNDNYPDIVAYDYYGGAPGLVYNLTVKLSTSGRFIGPVSKYPIYITAQGRPVAFGDFNGDTYLDVIVAGDPGNISMLINNGDGTFKPAIILVQGYHFDFLAVADVNQDGLIDFVSTSHVQSSFTAFLNLGRNPIVFSPASVNWLTALESEPHLVDMDNDGYKDVVVRTYTYGVVPSLSGQIVMFKNTRRRDAPYADAVVISPAAIKSIVVPLGSIRTADLNGDGFMDLAIAEQVTNTSQISPFLNMGNGSLIAQPVIILQTSISSFELADFNADGVPDLMCASLANPQPILYLGYGDGTFAALQSPVPPMPGTTYGVGFLQAADVNFDGNTDVMLSNYAEIGILIQKKNVTFQQISVYSGGLLANLPAQVDNPTTINIANFREVWWIGSSMQTQTVNSGLVTFKIDSPDVFTACSESPWGNMSVPISSGSIASCSITFRTAGPAKLTISLAEGLDNVARSWEYSLYIMPAGSEGSAPPVPAPPVPQAPTVGPTPVPSPTSTSSTSTPTATSTSTSTSTPTATSTSTSTPSSTPTSTSTVNPTTSSSGPTGSATTSPGITRCTLNQIAMDTEADIYLELKVFGCLNPDQRTGLLRQLEQAANLCTNALFEVFYAGAADSACVKRAGATTARLGISSQGQDTTSDLKSAERALQSQSSYAVESLGIRNLNAKKAKPFPVWAIALIVIVGVALLVATVGIVYFFVFRRASSKPQSYEMMRG